MSRRLPSQPLFAALLALAPTAPAAGLTASSPAAMAIVEGMIAAHGGYEAWAQAPSVSFEDRFASPGEPARVSRVQVEQGRRRVTIEVPGTGSRMAWDGEKAWSLGWEQMGPPRFTALLNYYFLNLPWLARDPGVVLGEPARVRVLDDPTEYIAIRMSFEPGVGDTPNDYYLLYIHPETHRLHGCEYVVTYRALLPEGVPHTPPHDLVFEEWVEADGLLVPSRYTIHEKNGTVYTTCTVENWSFSEPFDPARVEMPAGAVVDTSTP